MATGRSSRTHGAKAGPARPRAGRAEASAARTRGARSPAGRETDSPALGVPTATSEEELLAAARAAAFNAWAPYSRFRVGVALEVEGGRLIPGCNVENASYGLTICAERVAVGAAVSQGLRGFRRIAVVGGERRPVPPCGACRQVLFEFAPDLEVIASTLGNGGPIQRWKLAELLPDGFGPGDL